MVARDRNRLVERWVRALAYAQGLRPEKLRIEQRLDTQDFEVRGVDQNGDQRVLRIPAHELERMDFMDQRRMDDEMNYLQQKAADRLRNDAERQMASMYNDPRGTQGSSFQWNQGALGQGALGSYQNYRDEFLNFRSAGGLGGGGISSKPKKPKNFHGELQLELNDYLRDALH